MLKSVSTAIVPPLIVILPSLVKLLNTSLAPPLNFALISPVLAFVKDFTVSVYLMLSTAIVPEFVTSSFAGLITETAAPFNTIEVVPRSLIVPALLKSVSTVIVPVPDALIVPFSVLLKLLITPVPPNVMLPIVPAFSKEPTFVIVNVELLITPSFLKVSNATKAKLAFSILAVSVRLLKLPPLLNVNVEAPPLSSITPEFSKLEVIVPLNATPVIAAADEFLNVLITPPETTAFVIEPSLVKFLIVPVLLM